MKTRGITLKTARKKLGTISRAKVRKPMAAAYAQPIPVGQLSGNKLPAVKISFVV